MDARGRPTPPATRMPSGAHPNWRRIHEIREAPSTIHKQGGNTTPLIKKSPLPCQLTPGSPVNPRAREFSRLFFGGPRRTPGWLRGADFWLPKRERRVNGRVCRKSLYAIGIYEKSREGQLSDSWRQPAGGGFRISKKLAPRNRRTPNGGARARAVRALARLLTRSRRFV